MQRNLVSGFDDSYRRHLAIEQRRAVLDTIARELGPDTTLGDIVDAAQELGWNEVGELCLEDLAAALAGDADAPRETSSALTEADEEETDADEESDEEETDDETDDDEEEEETDEEEEEEDEEEEVAPRRGRKPAAEAAPSRKPSSMDRALDRIDRALAARGRKPVARAAAAEAKPAKGKKAVKKTAKKVSSRAAAAADDDTEAMSLDQAAKLLIPLVRKLKEATMQDLEEQTGMGRRKLRFHIGQLVKHGRLKRHGMGRGTCYTVK